MKTAQVLLDDWAWCALEAAASRQGVPVSALIQTAVEEKYRPIPSARLEVFRQWKAPWHDREDIGDAADYVRRLRDDGRIDSLYSE